MKNGLSQANFLCGITDIRGQNISAQYMKQSGICLMIMPDKKETGIKPISLSALQVFACISSMRLRQYDHLVSIIVGDDNMPYAS